MRVRDCTCAVVCGVSLLVLAACRDHPTAPSVESRLANASMVALSPTQLDTIVGSIVLVVVELDDRSGQPLATVPVQFTGPSGSHYSGVAYSTADGRATYPWTVPRAPGTYTLVAVVPNGPSVTFTVRASHGPPAVVVANTDILQAVNGGSTVYPSVTVRDGFGNDLSGVPVSFGIGGPSGASLERSTAVTNDSGLATPGGWTIGSAAGTYTLTARVDSMGQYSPLVTFTAHVNTPFSVTAINAGQFSDCAIGAAGASGTYCWGAAFNPSRLGDTEQMSVIPAAIANAPALVAVAVGVAHACGLTAAGAAYCWGDNSSGQGGGPIVANAAGAIHSVPGQIAFRQIVAGREFTCGLAGDGTAWCWGDGSTGQIGNGARAATRMPTAVSGNHVFSSLAAGDQHVCGLTMTNEVWCWGRDDNWQLGAASESLCRTINKDYYYGYYYGADSVQVTCALAPVKAAVPPLSSISASTFTCGLAVDGTALCWSGSFGARTAFASSAPLTQVVATGDGVCVLTNSGEVYCGDSPPLQRAAPTVPVRSITAGLAHQCAVARDSGIAFCWGANSAGQLGNGTLLASTTALPVAAPLPYGWSR